MANEITIAASISWSNGGSFSSGTLSKSITQAGTNGITATMEVGTTAELLPLGDISSPPGFLLVKNLDATNFVELAMWEDALGCSNPEFNPHKICKIGPGESRLITPPIQDDTADRPYVYIRADTAACAVQYWAVEA